MQPDTEAMLLFGAVHLVALVLGVLLFVLFLRSESVDAWSADDVREDGSDDGGGNDRRPSRPDGPRPLGPPLPDAGPSGERFREGGRLADRYKARPRRTVREPQRTPSRSPQRV